ncbi:MAG: SHOCT domain-containing protein [Clostridia bacterium]|nr:SHOCT domain-containing protein [Clostridia bacterium]
MKKYGWNDQEYYITTKKDERFSCWKNDGIFYMVEQPRECEKDYVQNEIKINEIKIDNILFYRVHYQHDYKANMYDVVSENSIKSVDNSFIVLKTKTETIELKISSLEALEALIPEKDYDRIEQSKENNTVIDAQVDEIAEIKKYKALLDEGIITEEDFEKKKKKLMGI